MIVIPEIKISNYDSPKIIADLKAKLEEFIEFDNIDESKDLLVQLEGFLNNNKKLARNNPAVYKQYQEFITILKFIALPTLPENEIADLLRTKLLTAVISGINLTDKLDSFFLLSRDMFADDQSRKVFAKALTDNNERIGDMAIMLEGGKEKAEPTVGNWLKDFARSFPSERRLAHLEEIEYSNKSPNFLKLTQRYKDILLNIIRIYTFLRYPERQGNSVRDTGHRVGPARLFTGEKAKSSVNDPVQVLKKKYQQYRSARQNVLEAEDEITVQTQGEADKIKRELAIASRKNDKTRVVACLKLMARQGSLVQALSENPAWFEAVSDYISKKYSKQYSKNEISMALGSLKLNAETPAAISEFLQYLLREKLKLDENTSALIGVEIGQLLGGQFQGLAYGNPANGNFEWEKNRIKNGSLVSEIG